MSFFYPSKKKKIHVFFCPKSLAKFIKTEVPILILVVGVLLVHSIVQHAVGIRHLDLQRVRKVEDLQMAMASHGKWNDVINNVGILNVNIFLING